MSVLGDFDSIDLGEVEWRGHAPGSVEVDGEHLAGQGPLWVQTWLG